MTTIHSILDHFRQEADSTRELEAIPRGDTQINWQTQALGTEESLYAEAIPRLIGKLRRWELKNRYMQSLIMKMWGGR